MKNAIAGIALALAAPAAFAQGPYVLFDLGQSTWDIDESAIERPFDGALVGTADDTDTTFGFGAGYAFSEHVAAEVEYRDLGTATYDGTLFGGSCAGALDADVEATAIDASLIGRMPVGNKWALTGRVGASRWDAEIGVDTACGSASVDDDGTDAVYGVGAEFDMTERARLVFNLRNNADVADEFDVLTLTLGAQFHF